MKNIKNYILKLKKYFIAFVVASLLVVFAKVIFLVNFYLMLMLFMCIYFLVLFLLRKKISFNKKEIIFSLIFSLLFSLTFYPLYSTPYQNFSISYDKNTSEKFYGDKSLEQSLKICNVKSGPFSINMEKTFGESCITLDEKNPKQDFTIAPNLPINVTYEGNSQSANAKIVINEKEFVDDSLNTKVTRTEYRNYEGISTIYPVYKSLVKFVILFISLTLINLIFLKLIKINKNFIYGLTTFNVLILVKFINLGNAYCILLLALFLLISFLIAKFYNSTLLKKWYSKINLIMFLLITFIITFMCVGYELFMATNKTFDFSFTSIMYFIVVFVYVAFVIFGLLLFFENIKIKKMRENLKNINKGTAVFLISFIVLSFAWIVFASIFYPGILSVDSIHSWMQASGFTEFDNLHPVFYSVFLYIFALIFNNPFSVIIFQNIVSALIISLIIRELYLKGINKIILLVVLLIFIFIPNISMMQATMWKDIPFSIALLLSTYLIYKLSLDEKNETRNILFLILFSVVLVLLLQFRYNGIIAVALIFVYLVILSIKKKNLFLSGVVVLTLLLNMVTNLCVNEIFNVRHIDVSGLKYASIVKNFSATLYYEKDLDDKAVENLETMFDKEKFSENYSSTNIDTLYNMESKNVYYWLPEINEYSMTEIIPLYIKNIFANFDVFMRDKLNGMNIMFNLNIAHYEPMFGYYTGLPQGSEEENSVIEEQIGMNLENTMNSEILKEVREGFNKSINGDFQNLIWRASFWVALLLVAFLYFFISNSKRSLIVFLPLFGYTLSWFITLNHQSFRYVYYINYIAIFAILLALILKERKNGN